MVYNERCLTESHFLTVTNVSGCSSMALGLVEVARFVVDLHVAVLDWVWVTFCLSRLLYCLFLASVVVVSWAVVTRQSIGDTLRPVYLFLCGKAFGCF